MLCACIFLFALNCQIKCNVFEYQISFAGDYLNFSLHLVNLLHSLSQSRNPSDNILSKVRLYSHSSPFHTADAAAICACLANSFPLSGVILSNGSSLKAPISAAACLCALVFLSLHDFPLNVSALAYRTFIAR